ncbi:MAG: protein-export chaperone SecB [Cohaesibacteraceae bacterium]
MSDSNDKDAPKEEDAANADEAKAENGATNGGGAAAAAAAATAAAQPAGAAGQGAQTAPRFQALAQYIKDLSVENPNAPDSFRNKTQPKIDINVSVGVNPKAEGTHEVVLKLEAKAGAGKDMLFAVELAYAGLFRLANMTQEQGQVALMIEAPRLLFPFAREILANATRQAGFPPLMLDPVDFLALYRQRAMQQQQGRQAAS